MKSGVKMNDARTQGGMNSGFKKGEELFENKSTRQTRILF